MRYVVLHHTGWSGHPDHYDLMLELDAGGAGGRATLKTFSTLKDAFPAQTSELKLIRDHRRAYLAYEGAVSRGRGWVKRVDAGEIISCDSQEPGPREITLQLAGVCLKGNFRLRLRGESTYVFEPR